MRISDWSSDVCSSDLPLSAPPAASLTFAGANIALYEGATIDVRGGGDLNAYEFIPGTGGSRDVLSRQNSDTYSGNNGLQYPDGRQVYANVHGASAAGRGACDPIDQPDSAAPSRQP